MRLEWINNKIITATAVLTFSFVAAAAYTAAQETEDSTTSPYQFVSSLLEAEASLYSTDIQQAQQARQNLQHFQQQALSALKAPVQHDEVALRAFVSNADRLIKAFFPSSREHLSVTQALAQKQGTQTLNTWLLLSIARQFDIESSLSLQQDHAHVVLKTQNNNWLEWRVAHQSDMQPLVVSALDDYDLWTAVDLTLIRHYVDGGVKGNDDSIDALAKAAAEDSSVIQAAGLYEEFLASRGAAAKLALLSH